MNTRRLLLALFGALVVSICCTAVLGRRIAQGKQTNAPTLHYAVAARALMPGEIVKPEDMNYTNWPLSQPVEGAFAKREDAAGRATVYPIEKGQIILNQYLAAPGAGIGLTTRIPGGMRAIALKSDEVVGVAGFLFPGARVDVLVTYRPSTGPDPVTSTVLQNAEVVAVGHQMQPDPTSKAAPADVVTIIANPEDAERVVLASTQGSIHFVMRNGGDQGQAPRPTVQMAELGGPPAAKPPLRRPAGDPAKPKPAYVVQTIAGDKLTSTTFN
jgi:pilus assembly protein CpaB